MVQQFVLFQTRYCSVPVEHCRTLKSVVAHWLLATQGATVKCFSTTARLRSACVGEVKSIRRNQWGVSSQLPFFQTRYRSVCRTFWRQSFWHLSPRTVRWRKLTRHCRGRKVSDMCLRFSRLVDDAMSFMTFPKTWKVFLSCNSLSVGDACLGDFKGVSGISAFIFILFLRESGFASTKSSRVGQNDRLRMVVWVTDVVLQLQLPLRGSSF